MGPGWLPVGTYTQRGHFDPVDKDPINLAYVGSLGDLEFVRNTTLTVLKLGWDKHVGDQLFVEPARPHVGHLQDFNLADRPFGTFGRTHTRIYQLFTPHPEFGTVVASPIHEESWALCDPLFNDAVKEKGFTPPETGRSGASCRRATKPCTSRSRVSGRSTSATSGRSTPTGSVRSSPRPGSSTRCTIRRRIPGAGSITGMVGTGVEAFPAGRTRLSRRVTVDRVGRRIDGLFVGRPPLYLGRRAPTTPRRSRCGYPTTAWSFWTWSGGSAESVRWMAR